MSRAAPPQAPALPDEDDGSWEAEAVPRWLPWVAEVFSMAGLAVSVYLTLTHYASSAVPLACSGTGAINCAKVTTSPQSMVFGVIPVAVLGLPFFAAMAALNHPAAWRSLRAWVTPLRMATAVVGMGFVLYLVASELLSIGAICIWCTAVHGLTFALFLLVASGTAGLGLGLGALRETVGDRRRVSRSAAGGAPPR